MSKSKTNSGEVLSVRLDKWLWAARFFKTRTLAHVAIEGGKVSVDGERAKPSRMVVRGLELEINSPRGLMMVIVENVSERRGSGADAAALYRETDESKTRRLELAELHRLSATTAPKIRPNTQDRRAIRKIKEG